MSVEIVKEGGNGGGGGNVVLGFILGGVMIAVAVVGFFMWDNYKFMWDNYKSGGAPTPASIHVTVKR